MSVERESGSRSFVVGPVRVGLPGLPPLLAAPLSPFLVDEPPTHSLVVERARGIEPGDPTVPLPEVRGTADGFSLSAIGLEASYVARDRRLTVRRAGSTGELASAVRWLLAYALLEHDVALVHGVGLLTGTRGCAFTGRSGAGKSTLGRTSGLPCVGDELVGIGADAKLYGTPWNVGRPAAVPLAMVGLLSWAKTPSLTTLEPSRWLQTAAENVLLPVPDAAGRARVFRVLSAMLARVRTVTLAFPPDASTGELIRAELA